jgi:hypothetical protein
MELSTVEVRWFQEGRCPAVVAEWFHRGSRVSEPERRTDEYLRLPDRDDIGVKRRAGVQLDLKLRTGRLVDPVLPDGFHGPVEAWTKWSFPLRSDTPLSGAGSWVAIDKRRWSRLYTATGMDAIGPVSSGADIDAGCSAELVELAVGGDRAWGFGFEAFGDCDRAELLAGTCRVLAEETPLGAWSFVNGVPHSYPAWLAERVWA